MKNEECDILLQTDIELYLTTKSYQPSFQRPTVIN